jgi:hypothetical protein
MKSYGLWRGGNGRGKLSKLLLLFLTSFRFWQVFVGSQIRISFPEWLLPMSLHFPINLRSSLNFFSAHRLEGANFSALSFPRTFFVLSFLKSEIYFMNNLERCEGGKLKFMRVTCRNFLRAIVGAGERTTLNVLDDQSTFSPLTFYYIKSFFVFEWEKRFL